MTTTYSEHPPAALSVPDGAELATDVSTRAVASISPHVDQHLYTNRHFLAANGHEDVVKVDDAATVPAIFTQFGRGLVHHGRMKSLTRAGMDRLSRTLFASTDAPFIIFEDVNLLDDGAPPAARAFVVKGQAHWTRGIEAGAAYVSNRQASNLRRKMKKLAAEHPGEAPRIEFRRASAADTDAIVAMNRTTIESAGRNYHMTGAGHAALRQVAGEIGYSCLLYADGKLISGDIILVCGSRAYFRTVGYEPEYEKYSPGLQVHVAALSELEKMGVEEIFLFWGDSRWKADIGAVRQQLSTVIVRRSNTVLLSPAYWRAAKPHLVQTAKQIVKQVIRRS